VPDWSIVARESELEAISSFLDLDQAGGRTLLLEGEAGIGKTALWRAGSEEATARGYRVLASSAAEAETQLALTTVRDLLANAFDEVQGDLPPPQRQALAVVLLREEPPERPIEPATVAVAFLTALQVLAQRTATLVAIDDVQWVDAASADVLRYALRRLDAARVDALLARRGTDGAEPLVPGAQVLEVGPISIGALGRILRHRLGVSYARPTLHRVHDVSAGNPFYALEIARTIRSEIGSLRGEEPLPIPGSLLHLVRDRVASLPGPTFEALAVASALSRPTVETIAAALDADAATALAPAVAAEIVWTDGTAVWFAHPLFAASVYELAAPRHREIHARLAGLVADVEERARHLVRAEFAPRAAVAEAIDAGAAAAAARGGPGAAAELAEAAARLTPLDAPSDRIRRLIGAADWHFAAGDVPMARSVLSPLAADMPPGPDRARILLRLAVTMDSAAALRLLELALEDAAGDIELQAEVQVGVAKMEVSLGVRAGLEAAGRAVELAERAGQRELLVAARGIWILCAGMVGSRIDPDVVEWAVEQHEAHRDGYPPAVSAALWLMYHEHIDRARAVLEDVMRTAVARGDEMTLSTATFHLAELECRAGRYDLAAERAAESLAFDEATGIGQWVSGSLYAAALADTYRGRVSDARTAAERGLESARAKGDILWGFGNEATLGFLELSLGDARAAADRLAPLWKRLVAFGFGEPSYFPVLPNAIHALFEAGDRPQAERLLDQLEERGEALDSAWALSQALRLRALLVADDGHSEQALALIDQALLQHERMPGPFERGRTLLARGAILRRARRKREARIALGQALAIFEDLGTPLWATKARAEMARIGGRAPAGDELTPSERRIAELVADGKTNKEVAAILVVADRTVESALTQIYRKLDVRSRTELAHRLASSD
jgi:DNA-binding CsgD family transcriptional regulator